MSLGVLLLLCCMDAMRGARGAGVKGSMFRRTM
jgi:hypothetical protein